MKAAEIHDASVEEADEVTMAFGANLENGLTSQDASRRLSTDGRNELRSAPRAPTWRRVLSQFQDALVYLLLAAVAGRPCHRARRLGNRMGVDPESLKGPEHLQRILEEAQTIVDAAISPAPS